MCNLYVTVDACTQTTSNYKSFSVKAAPPNAHFTNFDTEDGLALSTVYTQLCDRNGNLWFGTYGGGVSRYDGKSFTNYSIEQGLTNKVVLSSAEDKDHNLWFGTNGSGLFKYDGRKIQPIGEQPLNVFRSVRSILIDNENHVWYSTIGQGVSCYKGITIDEYTIQNGLPSDSVFCMLLDGDGGIWFGASRKLFYYNGDEFEDYTTEFGLEGTTIRDLKMDTNGRLWIATTSLGVGVYNGDSIGFLTDQTGLLSNEIRCLQLASDGSMWIGTVGGGLSSYDNGTISTITTDEGLITDDIYAICLDKNNKLWISQAGGGVSRYEGDGFVSFDGTKGLSSDYVYNICQDTNGNLWFSTDGDGIIRYDGESFEHITDINGFAINEYRYSLCAKDGTLWFGNYRDGLCRYKNGSFQVFTSAQGLVNNQIRSLAEDLDGNLWIGTTDGLSVFNGESFKNFLKKDGLPSAYINDIESDSRGNIWIGTMNGLAQYDGTEFVQFNNVDGCPKEQIVSIEIDEHDNIWIGALNSGLYRFDGNDFLHFETKSGLASNYVYAMAFDMKGVLWVGTALGLSGLSFTSESGETISTSAINASNQLIRTKYSPVWEVYNTLTGYPVKDLNTNAMLVTTRQLPKSTEYDIGVLWGGCGDINVIRFAPGQERARFREPKLKFDKVKVNQRAICWYTLQMRSEQSTDLKTLHQQEHNTYGHVLSELERDSIQKRYAPITFTEITKFDPVPLGLSVPYDFNHITLSYKSIETSATSSIQYQYMLIGQDEHWSPATTATEVSFSNLSEGDFTLMLRAKSLNGNWTEPIEYSFTVIPPWYRSIWAYIAYIVCILFVTWAFIKWRTGDLLRRQKQLQHEIRAATADIRAQKKVTEEERDRSEYLLHNILPEEIALELKEKGESDARLFDQCTVLFTDFKGFTTMAEALSPKELVKDLNLCFSEFDKITSQYGIEKIKTIGDAYMAAGGLPTPTTNHAKKVVLAALEMADFVLGGKQQKNDQGLPYFEVRIGIHTGPVVAGIVGVKKFQYDIWGDTVNTASRMESSSEVGRVNISQATYEILKDDPQFAFENRGKIEAKGKGEMEMWFVNIKY